MTPVRLVKWTAALAVLTAACAAPPVGPVPPRAQSSGLSQEEAEVACESEEGEPLSLSAQETAERILGAWQLCRFPSFFEGDDGGIEFTTDHRWYKLARSSNGTLRRMLSWDDAGTWQIFDMSDMNGPGAWAMDLILDGSRTSSNMHPIFPAGSPKMRLGSADYVPAPVPTGGSVESPFPTASPLTTDEACTVPEGGEALVATHEEFLTRIVGVWQLCGRFVPSVFGSDETALEIASDRRWYKVDRSTNGNFIRRLGWDNQGVWSSPPEGPERGTLRFRIDGSGEVSTQPVFAVSVPKMRLSNSGVADYVKVGPERPPPQPGRPPSDPSAACVATEGGEVPFESEAAFVEQLVGVWQLCAKPSVFGTNEDGLEITSGQRWYKLKRASDGSLVRLTGPKDHGDWITAYYEPGYGQLDLRLLNGWHVSTIPDFGVDTPKMRLNNNSVFVADYVRLPL